MSTLDFDSYKPDVTETIWLGVERMLLPSGATLALVGSRYPAYLFDASADETVRCSFYLPGSWHNVRVQLMWSNISANSGNVVWQVATAKPAASGAISSDSSTAQVTAAASGNAIRVITGGLPYIDVAGADINHLRVTRKGTLAADTLINDAAFLGVLLTRRS